LTPDVVLLPPPLIGCGPFAVGPPGVKLPEVLRPPPLMACGPLAVGPPGVKLPDVALPPPRTFFALVLGSIDLMLVWLVWSTCCDVWCVALRFVWTSVNALAPRSAWETAFSLDALSAGTANNPMGPSALPLKLRPRRPDEMLDSRDPRSPALLCNPCMEESFME
jgi:hypothetical protein